MKKYATVYTKASIAAAESGCLCSQVSPAVHVHKTGHSLGFLHVPVSRALEEISRVSCFTRKAVQGCQRSSTQQQPIKIHSIKKNTQFISYSVT